MSQQKAQKIQSIKFKSTGPRRQNQRKNLMNIQKSHLQLRSKFFIFFLALAISAGSFVMGYSLVGTALLEEYIQSANNIPKQQIGYYLSVIITLLPLGAIVGSVVSTKIITLIGQKNTMIFVDTLMAIAIIAQSISLDLQVMYVTRLIFGFFCGISSGIIPPYLTSISPLNMTGFIGSFNQLLITVGISVAYALNFFLESDIMEKRYQIVIFILTPLPFCLLRIFTLSYIFPYDTAERHFEKNQFQSVKSIMNSIYEGASYDNFCKVKNLHQLHHKSQKDKDKNSDTSSNSSVAPLTPLGQRRIIIMAIVIALANQVCGINAIFFYAKQLFTNLTGGDQEWVKKDLFGLGIFQVILTFISSFLLDKFGRRSLMLVGLSILTFSLFAAFFATDIFHLSSDVVVFLIFLHLFGFSISLGPVCGLYASEIMQDISLVIILMWSETLIVALISDWMIKELGIGKTFMIFGILSLGCLLYFWREMIESRGLNRAQLEERFSNKTNQHVRINSTQQFDQMQEEAQN